MPNTQQGSENEVVKEGALYPVELSATAELFCIHTIW